MSSWLCIGNGASLVQYEDYIVYNNYDYKIGTKLQAENKAWQLDYIAAADAYAVEDILREYPDWQNRIISRRTSSQLYHVLQPRLHHARDVTGTIQCRWAIEQGATHITTIAFDSLAGSWEKDTLWPWSYKKQEPPIKDKQSTLVKAWSKQITDLQSQYPKIEWQHKHIGNTND